MCLQFYFVFFCRKNSGAKAAQKMLMKLSTDGTDDVLLTKKHQLHHKIARSKVKAIVIFTTNEFFPAHIFFADNWQLKN